MSVLTTRSQKPECLHNVSFYDTSLKIGKHELPVVGTFIHEYILPGFKYRVRLIGTNDYLFGRKPMRLDSVGQGYGRRITFESEDILENNNFFWSDSQEAGYAFSPEILSVGEIFQVVDCKGNEVGTFLVNSVDEQQAIAGVSLDEQTVSLHATVGICGSMQLLSQCEEDIRLFGEVSVTADRNSCSFEFVNKENSGSCHAGLRFIKHLKL